MRFSSNTCMRVLHLGKYHPPVAGGMETYLGDLLPALREQGIDARALVHDSSARGYRRDGVWAVPRSLSDLTRGSRILG